MVVSPHSSWRKKSNKSVEIDLPKKASVVDDCPVDDGAWKHSEEGHEDGLEAEGERLVSDLDASQSN